MLRLQAVIAVAVILLPQVLHSEERNKIRELVTVDYEARNPCSNEQVRIVGSVVLDGYYVEVDDGYKIRGEVDYSDLVARSVASDRVYQVRGSKDDRVRMTVDIPVERTVTQDAVFRSGQSSFAAKFSFEFSVSFFGDKDVDLVGIRTTCLKSTATKGASH